MGRLEKYLVDHQGFMLKLIYKEKGDTNLSCHFYEQISRLGMFLNLIKIGRSDVNISNNSTKSRYTFFDIQN